MPRAVVRPFRVASAASVPETHPWTLIVEGGRTSPDNLRRYLRREEVVELESSITVDLEELQESTGLDDSATVHVIFLWECRATRRREVGARFVIERGANTYTCVFGIETSQIAESLILERQLVLAAPPASPGQHVATHPASILWREPAPLRIDLEGIGGVLPTDFARFRDEADPAAVWALRIQLADLDLPATAAVKLLLNEAHPDIQYIATTERWDDRARALLSTIYWDVGRSLLDLALENSEFDVDGAYMEDSIGRSLQLLFGWAFGEASPASVRELRTQRPVAYQTALQARLGLLQGRRFRRYSTAPGPAAELAFADRVEGDRELETRARGNVPVAQPDELATYKQVKLIVAMSGQWLGENAIRVHKKYPQPPLTKTDARRLIDRLNEIPDVATDAREKRSAIVEGFLAQRQAPR